MRTRKRKRCEGCGKPSLEVHDENNRCEECIQRRYYEVWRGNIAPQRSLEARMMIRELLGVVVVTLGLLGGLNEAWAGEIKQGRASWYGQEACKYNSSSRCPTASGKSLYELERKQVPFAASWDYPFGTRLRVTNRDNGKSVVATVWDRGPARRLKRKIDLSKQAFEQIADLKKGIIEVSYEKI